MTDQMVRPRYVAKNAPEANHDLYVKFAQRVTGKKWDFVAKKRTDEDEPQLELTVQFDGVPDPEHPAECLEKKIWVTIKWDERSNFYAYVKAVGLKFPDEGEPFIFSEMINRWFQADVTTVEKNGKQINNFANPSIAKGKSRKDEPHPWIIGPDGTQVVALTEEPYEEYCARMAVEFPGEPDF